MRALRIGDRVDLALLQAIARGEFAAAGFRNADIRDRLIRKVQRSHRYRLTPRGQLLTAALFAARSATLKQFIARPHRIRAPRGDFHK